MCDGTHYRHTSLFDIIKTEDYVLKVQWDASKFLREKQANNIKQMLQS